MIDSVEVFDVIELNIYRVPQDFMDTLHTVFHDKQIYVFKFLPVMKEFLNQILLKACT